MKIILTGGTGLIGQELGKALVKKGHNLILLTRNPGKSKAKVSYPHQAIRWDGEKEILSKDVFNGVDGIFHLSGLGIAEQRWNKKFKQRLKDSRILATKNLLQNAPKDLKFFIGASAIGYYKSSEKEFVSGVHLTDKKGCVSGVHLTEEEPAAENFFGHLCKNWESKAYEILDSKKTLISHVRTGIVLSPKGGALETMVKPLKTGLGGPLGDGRQIMSWIDIEDLIGIYCHILDNKLSGPYNAVSPNPVTNLTLTNSIGKIIHRPTSIPVPKLLLKLVLGELSEYILMSQNVSCEKIVNSKYTFKFSDLEQSLKKNLPELSFLEKRFYNEQYINSSLEKVFEFFSNENNLESITPPSLKFKVLSKSTDKIDEGTFINYKLRLDGIIPIKWKTLIKKWNPPYVFQDVQIKGPYKKWHHTHSFEKLGDGVLMKDLVDYKLPFGLIGYIFGYWKVKSDVNKIFQYRSKVIEKLF